MVSTIRQAASASVASHRSPDEATNVAARQRALLETATATASESRWGASDALRDSSRLPPAFRGCTSPSQARRHKLTLASLGSNSADTDTKFSALPLHTDSDGDNDDSAQRDNGNETSASDRCIAGNSVEGRLDVSSQNACDCPDAHVDADAGTPDNSHESNNVSSRNSFEKACDDQGGRRKDSGTIVPLTASSTIDEHRHSQANTRTSGQRLPVHPPYDSYRTSQLHNVSLNQRRPHDTAETCSDDTKADKLLSNSRHNSYLDTQASLGDAVNRRQLRQQLYTSVQQQQHACSRIQTPPSHSSSEESLSLSFLKQSGLPSVSAPLVAHHNNSRNSSFGRNNCHAPTNKQNAFTNTVVGLAASRRDSSISSISMPTFALDDSHTTSYYSRSRAPTPSSSSNAIHTPPSSSNGVHSIVTPSLQQHDRPSLRTNIHNTAKPPLSSPVPSTTEQNEHSICNAHAYSKQQSVYTNRTDDLPSHHRKRSGQPQSQDDRHFLQEDSPASPNRTRYSRASAKQSINTSTTAKMGNGNCQNRFPFSALIPPPLRTASLSQQEQDRPLVDGSDFPVEDEQGSDDYEIDYNQSFAPDTRADRLRRRNYRTRAVARRRHVHPSDSAVRTEHNKPDGDSDSDGHLSVPSDDSSATSSEGEVNNFQSPIYRHAFIANARDQRRQRDRKKKPKAVARQPSPREKHLSTDTPLTERESSPSSFVHDDDADGDDMCFQNRDRIGLSLHNRPNAAWPGTLRQSTFSREDSKALIRHDYGLSTDDDGIDDRHGVNRRGNNEAHVKGADLLRCGRDSSLRDEYKPRRRGRKEALERCNSISSISLTLLGDESHGGISEFDDSFLADSSNHMKVTIGGCRQSSGTYCDDSFTLPPGEPGESMQASALDQTAGECRWQASVVSPDLLRASMALIDDQNATVPTVESNANAAPLPVARTLTPTSMRRRKRDIANRLQRLSVQLPAPRRQPSCASIVQD